METIDEVREQRAPVAGFVVLGVGLALMAGLSWQAAGDLPDPVILAGAGKNGADQQAPKMLVLIGAPLLSLVLTVVLLAAQRFRRLTAATLKVPLWRDDRTHRRAVSLVLGVLTPVFLGLHLMLLRAAVGEIESTLGYLAAAVAIVVVVVGNIWPKQAPAVPGMLRARLDPGTRQRWDDAVEAQRRNLRPAGIVMVVLGLVALACSWSVPMVSFGLSMAAILAMAAITFGTFWRSVAGSGSSTAG
ncbi:hypothetical protein [Actinoplanes couchii]|uniref:DUF1648 domain-containing protein n=1 Tax=Actinoplanes couchii TaxID=403638 RepID=A0ABQ3XHP8_9ACTN|nr:hypothetical protein [Actinoplanes couchii]MDR6317626.1 protein-S-isoprenylcysteine O-methyltransferase Ste14 [Actinoplanes couchii]GID58011.1 hypothetical protein Aco03nite_064150 [Actinoplanes couchii]